MSGPFKRPLAGLKVQSLKKSNQLLRSLLRKFKKTRLTFDLGRNKDHFYGRRAKLLLWVNKGDIVLYFFTS